MTSRNTPYGTGIFVTVHPLARPWQPTSRRCLETQLQTVAGGRQTAAWDS